VILLALMGHRVRPVDIALFVIALLVLGAVSVGPVYSKNQATTYSALKNGSSGITQIDVLTSTSFGSISISYSSGNTIAYQVTFNNSVWAFPFVVSSNQHTFSNTTRDGVLFLNASATASSISIILGKGYLVNVNASTDAGSISLNSPRSERLGRIFLSTQTGSVDAEISSSGILGIRLSSSAGSVNLQSDYLSPGNARVPIDVSTSAGSVSMSLKIAPTTAVSIGATDSFGSISHSLSNQFTVSQDTRNAFHASAGDASSASQSFVISASANVGSVSINAQFAE